jgi:uncharacterized membrane protein YbhN (UPF0104 family)
LRLVAVAFALAALGGVLWVADLGEVLARLRGADPLALAGAAAAFFAIYPVSAVRLLRSVALPLRPHLAAATLVGLRHTFLLTAMPARLGDAAYPVLVARGLPVGLGPAVGNLLVLRLADLIVVALAFGGSLFLVLFAPGGATSLLWAVPAVLILIAAAALWRLAALLRGGARRALALPRVGVRVARTMLAAAAWTRRLSLARRTELFGWTLLRWIPAVVALGLLFAAYGEPQTPPAVVFLSTGVNLVAVIPAQAFGGLGTMEASLALLLVALGTPPASAAALGLMVWLTWQIFPLIGGALGEGAAMLDRHRRTRRGVGAR